MLQGKINETFLKVIMSSDEMFSTSIIEGASMEGKTKYLD